MVTQNRRAILKAVGSMTVVGGLAGCADTGDEEDNGGENQENEEGQEGQQEGAESGMTRIRAAHLSPDAPNVDIYINGETALENVGYRDISAYNELQSGTYDVQVTEAGAENNVLYEDSLAVETGTYTLAAIGEASGENQPLSVEVIEDDLSDPGDQARVSALHAAADAPAVDVIDQASGDTLVENLAFGDNQSAEVPPGDYTLEISPSENGDSSPVTFDVSLTAGTVYSAFAVGYLSPDDAPVDEAFDLEIVENSSGMNG